MGKTNDYKKQIEKDIKKEKNKIEADKKAESAKYFFNKRLKELFESKKLTQVKVEFDTGISRTTFKQYVQGKSNLEYSECLLGTLAILSDYFNVSTDYLLGKTNIKNPDYNIRRISELTGLNSNTVSILIAKNKKRQEGKDHLTSFPPIALFINFIVNSPSFFSVMETASDMFMYYAELEYNSKSDITYFEEEDIIEEMRQKERQLNGLLNADIANVVNEFINDYIKKEIKKKRNEKELNYYNED